MKKRILTFSLLILCMGLFGCSMMKKTPKDAVNELMKDYRGLGTNVLSNLEEIIKKEDFSKDQQDEYRDIMKKQYRDLKYEVMEESIDGNDAIVKVKITVYDLYKIQNDAAIYLNGHMDEFKDNNGVYDNKKYLDYKLEQMKKAKDTVQYTLNIKVTKNNKEKWEVKDLSRSELDKIHGVYNYTME